MRQYAGATNRVWLAVVGLLLVLAGVAGLVATTGGLRQLLAATGVGGSGPAGGSVVLDAAVGSWLDRPLGAAVVGVVGVVLGLLGLFWLVAQIPRTNAARPFRLHDEGSGLTVCDPGVLADAVERELRSYPGVSTASAVLRGTATAPELTVQVNADDRTDLVSLLTAIDRRAVADLARALDAPVARLAVQLDIDRGQRSTRHATIRPAPIRPAPIRPAPIRPDPVRPDPVRPDPVR